MACKKDEVSGLNATTMHCRMGSSYSVPTRSYWRAVFLSLSSPVPQAENPFELYDSARKSVKLRRGRDGGGGGVLPRRVGPRQVGIRQVDPKLVGPS